MTADLYAAGSAVSNIFDLIRSQSVILHLQKLQNNDLANDKPEKQRSYKKEKSCVKIELCSLPEEGLNTANLPYLRQRCTLPGYIPRS